MKGGEGENNPGRKEFVLEIECTASQSWELSNLKITPSNNIKMQNEFNFVQVVMKKVIFTFFTFKYTY